MKPHISTVCLVWNKVHKNIKLQLIRKKCQNFAWSESVCTIQRSISTKSGRSDEEDDIVRDHDLIVILHPVDRGPQLGVWELDARVIGINLLADLVQCQWLLVFLLERFEQRRLERLQSVDNDDDNRQLYSDVRNPRLRPLFSLKISFYHCLTCLLTGQIFPGCHPWAELCRGTSWLSAVVTVYGWVTCTEWWVYSSTCQWHLPMHKLTSKKTRQWQRTC